MKKIVMSMVILIGLVKPVHAGVTVEDYRKAMGSKDGTKKFEIYGTHPPQEDKIMVNGGFAQTPFPS